MTMIYHYTSGASLLGIIGNGEFWATDINFLNDHKEHILGYEASIDIIRNVMTEDFEEPYESWFKKFYFTMLEISKSNIIDRAAYIVSFSQNPDSIAHWFSYCEKNQGYCIGLEEDDFLYEDIELTGAPDHALGFENVVYGDVASIEQRLIRILSKAAILQRMLDALKTSKLIGIDIRHDSPHSEKFKENTGLELMQSIFSELIFCSSAFKEIGFTHEAERRLIICSKDIPESPRAASSNTKFRERNGVIYPYTSIKFNPKSIKEIIIGPCSDYELKEAGLLKLLQSKKIECTVRKSSSSLRFT